MPDYKTEQDWLMGEIEAQQKQIEQRELLETIAGIDRKLRSRIVWVIRSRHKVLAADLTAKACFERWKSAYMAQRTEAIVILDLAKEIWKPYSDIEGF